MNIEKLKTFVVAAQSSSYYSAAEKLFTSVTTVSKHIQSLETEWGMDLFERLPKGSRLTEFGEAALPYAKKILESYEEILRIPAGEQPPSVKIYSIPNQADFYINDFLDDFSFRHPEIELSVYDCHGGLITEALENGKCDLGFGGLPFLNKQRVDVIPTERSRTGVLMSKDHPFAGRARLSVKELKNERFILLSPETGVYEYQLNFCRSHGFEPRVAEVKTRESSIVDRVELGRGIALFHEISMRFFRDRKVVLIPLKEPIYMEAGLVKLKNRPLSPAARIMWNYARAKQKKAEDDK